MSDDHGYSLARCIDCENRVMCSMCLDCEPYANVCDRCLSDHRTEHRGDAVMEAVEAAIPATIIDVTAPRDYGYFTSRIDGPGFLLPPTRFRKCYGAVQYPGGPVWTEVPEYPKGPQ